MEIGGTIAARLQEATGFLKATTPPPTSGGHARGRGHWRGVGDLAVLCCLFPL